MTAQIDISALEGPSRYNWEDLRAFWAAPGTYRFDPTRAPVEQTSEWITGVSGVPWLELDFDIKDHEAMAMEALACRDLFVDHREDASWGWRSLVLHGLNPASTRSATNYGFNSDAEAPYAWTSVADRCPVTVAFLKRLLAFRRLNRVRFMLLDPMSCILPHIDTWNRSLTGLNIALTNPPGAHFKLLDKGCVPFKAGRAFLVDISNTHSCINLSQVPRVHIIAHADDPLPAFTELVRRSFRRTWGAAPANANRAASLTPAANPSRLARLCEETKHWVERGGTQALAYVVMRRGEVIAREAYGRIAPQAPSGTVSCGSIFRMSSVSKVVTAAAAMTLVDDGKLSLNRPVADYLPEFGVDCRRDILVFHLLTHTSGLHTIDYERHLKERHTGPNGAGVPLAHSHWFEAACATVPREAPGALCRYSGVNYVLLGEVIGRCAGQSFDALAKERIFEPLGMRDTRYGLSTEAEGQWVRMDEGMFRDISPPYNPNDVSELRIAHPGGHLFSTADDMASFGQMFLNHGHHKGARILSPASVAAMTRNQIPGTPAAGPGGRIVPMASWGLGWIVQSAHPWKKAHGTLPAPGTYYHQGASGVGIWCDPLNEIVGVFLSTIRAYDAATDEFDWDFDLFQNLATAAAF